MTRQRVGEIMRDAATLASTHLATKLDSHLRPSWTQQFLS
jgi:hypothetical protein